MNTFFAVARTVHYASTLVLFGEFVLVLLMTLPAWRTVRRRGTGNAIVVTSVIARWSMVASLASGIAWLAAEAAAMSGLTLAHAIAPDVLGRVLWETAFGRVWMLRFALCIVLGVLLVVSRRSNRERSGFLPLTIGATAAAAVYLAALAWTGHAAAGTGTDGDIEIVADVVHLIAAGAWLGALPGFAVVLARAHSTDAAALVARRFSTLAALCVFALIASGVVNAWFRIGDVPALIGTDYGRILLAKLALFAAMLAVALASRGSVALRLAHGETRARSSLRRNVLLEIALGIGVVSLVGVLGLTVPAAHQVADWPFTRTLSAQPLDRSAWLQLIAGALGAIACIAGGIVLKGALGRPPRFFAVALVGVALSVAILAWLLAVPAHPATYRVSPVGYTVDAIADGAAHYARECRACHGGAARGEFLAPGALPAGRTDLFERLPDRREGDLFWSIAQGVPGTPMPGFAPRIGATEIWNLIRFLDAWSATQDALALTDRVLPLPQIVAPDFTFETSGRSQESLRELRKNQVVLLVLYSLPDSLPRLQELVRDEPLYTAAGARVIAVPLTSASTAGNAAQAEFARPIIARASGNVAAVYAMFARSYASEADEAPAHVELLVDRQGYLRVRWQGAAADAVARTAATLDRIDALNREPPREPAPWGHVHR